MKIQIRQRVFETNSSSTHCLSVYSKEDWNDFKNGKKQMFGLLEDIADPDSDDLLEQYHKHLIKYDVTEEDLSFEDFKSDWFEVYSNESLNEEYEVLAKDTPDGKYVAVSIYGHD